MKSIVKTSDSAPQEPIDIDVIFIFSDEDVIDAKNRNPKSIRAIENSCKRALDLEICRRMLWLYSPDEREEFKAQIFYDIYTAIATGEVKTKVEAVENIRKSVWRHLKRSQRYRNRHSILDTETQSPLLYEDCQWDVEWWKVFTRKFSTFIVPALADMSVKDRKVLAKYYYGRRHVNSRVRRAREKFSQRLLGHLKIAYYLAPPYPVDEKEFIELAIKVVTSKSLKKAMDLCKDNGERFGF